MPRATDPAILEQAATLPGFAASRVPGSPLFGRTAALQEQLRRLMQDERELTPPAPHDPGDEDRQWRAQGEDVIRRIEAGVRAVEERIARERGAAS